MGDTRVLNAYLKKGLAMGCAIVLLFSLKVPTVYGTAMASQNSVDAATITTVAVTDTNAQIRALRSAMLSRRAAIKLTYEGDISDLETNLQKVLDQVFALNYMNTSTDSDYLANIVSSFKASYSYTSDHADLTYQFVYRETKAQTYSVNAKIAEVLTEMNISEKTTYQKIKLIHDYIVNRNTYDLTYQKYTAYNALIEKSSVCQGYALLAYKMLTEAGVPTKIITGYGKGVAHAWNIVKLNGVWYNLDCTWDDPVTDNGEQVLQYDYFLKNETDFSDHQRDARYLTNAFLTKYPMTKNSYGTK